VDFAPTVAAAILAVLLLEEITGLGFYDSKLSSQSSGTIRPL